MSFLISASEGGVTKAEYDDAPGGVGALGLERSAEGGGGDGALCGRTKTCCFVRIHSGPKCIAVVIVVVVDIAVFVALNLREGKPQLSK